MGLRSEDAESAALEESPNHNLVTQCVLSLL